MYLLTDEQTIEDLRLFARADQPGIYDIYNNTFTRGGEQLLHKLFRSPLSDPGFIARRAAIIAAFAAMHSAFPFKGAVLDNVEKYLAHTGASGNDPLQSIAMGEKEISNGVTAVVELLHVLKQFLEKGDIQKISEWQEERNRVLLLLASESLQPVFQQSQGAKLSFGAITAFDALIRNRERQKILELLQFIYQLDVYISVATVANKHHFVFPEVLAPGSPVLQLQGVWHPELAKPVANNLLMNAGKSVVFLTGANMAGKSTFLRAVCTAVYVAHMGFPVAAGGMKFTVMDGVYTTINLPDNLGIGASHFYAEVTRVKKVAAELSRGISLFVVFDELFRGTNVKDAEEGTVAVTKGFAGCHNSLFIISSHIVEAGAQLEERKNIVFHFLPTKMNGNQPVYTYTIEEGISEDRHGMVIIRNEGILEILKNGRKSAGDQLKISQ